ncbi:MAG: diguanylate cyclase [Acholeplasma sp.]|nr:diguanylate cyclase [Acholeplasma sp.]
MEEKVLSSKIKIRHVYIIISLFSVLLAFFSVLLLFVLENIPLLIVSSSGIVFLQLSYFLANKKKYLLVYTVFSLYTILAIISSAFILEAEFEIVNYLVILVPFCFTLLYENIPNRLMMIVSLITMFLLIISYIVFYNISDSVNPNTNSPYEVVQMVRIFTGAAIIIMVFLFIILFIYRLEKAKQEVRNMVNRLDNEVKHDYLTGLHSRRFADQLFKDMVNQEKDIWIMIVDIDQFKDINDQYGHQTGDEVLRMISKILTDYTDKHDYMIRWGGDEFLIVLCDKTEKEVIMYEKVLTSHINGIDLLFNNHQFKVTASLGYAKYTQGKCIDDAIQQADLNMYQSKFSKMNLIED